MRSSAPETTYCLSFLYDVLRHRIIYRDIFEIGAVRSTLITIVHLQISAQESRRKKKEYMDQLERKVELLVTENNDYRQKIDTLETSNTNLMKQLKTLEAIVARTHPQIVKQFKLTNWSLVL